MPMATAPLNKIERAHQMYREGLYVEALRFYTEALSMAKTKSQRIALHSNRAACHLKLHDFNKAAEECTWVLELDHKHTGALMLRAQTLVTLKEYHSALFDVNRLIELNPSSEVYQNLHTRLKTQLVWTYYFLLLSYCLFSNQFNVYAANEKCNEGKEYAVTPSFAQIQKPEHNCNLIEKKIIKTTQGNCGLSEVERVNQKVEVKLTTKSEVVAPREQIKKGITTQGPNGWQTIPKPKGHSALDYARWDRVEDDSSEDDDDDEEEDSGPQFRFRVRTVGVKPVK
ncbi:peptidyl-prolyl cis-trans isomerase FKBP5 [Cucumis melo var. makuwa]|uniref:Peptidyl-prolyl cis-trans isomerase FKBP5 n=1 Tax=Cucumis melo var. makuwa TaxID=1194695 RepID=A0A5A7UM82_CUCMM|nr:peptidyl-prolyl cis-trans isomerase FKBP5 [Cucumis melo var. makuwa]